MNTKLKVRVEFSVDMANVPMLNEIDMEEFSRIVSADGYSDGRKNFNIEMMECGLVNHIENSIRIAITNKYRELYGNEMISTGPKSSTSKAVLEAEKEMNKLIYVYANWRIAQVEKEKENEK